MELRDYQEEAVKAIATAQTKGITRQLVVIPTGGGKTVIFAQLHKYIENTLPMLVLAHREELLTQAKDKILAGDPTLRVEIEQGQNYADRTDCDVVVASVPTLGRANSSRINEFDKDYFRTIIVDEAHHAAAPSYRNVLDYFNADLLLGVTATPQRGDNVRLTDVFDEVVYFKSIEELIREGYLTNLVGYQVKTDTDISGVATQAGDYVDSQLSKVINTPERNALIVKSWQTLANKEKSLVFCTDIQHAEDVERAFRAADVRVSSIFGKTESAERLLHLTKLAEGELDVLVNVGVLTEGFDEPSIKCILLARPTKSSLLYTQIVGRGTRLFDGKDHCKIIDFADVVGKQKPTGLPSLVGLPPDFDCDGKDLLEVADFWKDLNKKSPSEASRAKNLADIELAYSKIDLFRPPVPSEAVVEFSTFIWSELSESDFYLGMPFGESLHISGNALGQFEVSFCDKAGLNYLGTAQDLRSAFSVADTWVKQNQQDQITLIDSTALWRSEPPTEKQIKWLKKYGVPITEDLSKGAASQILDKLFAESPQKPKPVWLQNKINAQRSMKNF